MATDIKQQIQDEYARLIKHMENASAAALAQGSATGQSQYGDYQNYLQKIRGGLNPLLEAADLGVLDSAEAGVIEKYLLDYDQGVTRQGINEMVLSGRQRAEQKNQLDKLRADYEKRIFGGTGYTLEQALSDPQGDLEQLGNFLKKQQSEVFNEELKPLINMKLGAQGLMDSGANIELQSKALGGLERERQASLMESALGARNTISNLERVDTMGDIGYAQQTLSNYSDIQRQGITMAFQQRLASERDRLAKELAQRPGASDWMDYMQLGFQGVNAASNFKSSFFKR